MKAQNINKMALVRTLRPFSREPISRDDYAEEFDRMTQAIQAIAAEADTVYIPVSSDVYLGGTAVGLAESLNENGTPTVMMSPWSTARGLDKIIQDTRTDLVAAPTTIPRIVEYADTVIDSSRTQFERELKVEKLGHGALVVVTSEPFMIGVAEHQDRFNKALDPEQLTHYRQGGVAEVDLDTF
jgi:DNA-binding NtrC family response regulator